MNDAQQAGTGGPPLWVLDDHQQPVELPFGNGAYTRWAAWMKAHAELCQVALTEIGYGDDAVMVRTVFSGADARTAGSRCGPLLWRTEIVGNRRGISAIHWETREQAYEGHQLQVAYEARDWLERITAR
jgi:hypothetical protein